MNVATQMSREDEIAAWCAAYIGRVLNIAPTEIQLDDEIERFGLDSAITTSMLIDLEEWLAVEISPAVLFEQSTLRGIASAVAALLN